MSANWRDGGSGRDDKRDLVPVTDERWATPLGQEILANEIRIRVNSHSYSPDSFDRDDSMEEFYIAGYEHEMFADGRSDYAATYEHEVVTDGLDDISEKFGTESFYGASPTDVWPQEEWPQGGGGARSTGCHLMK